MPNFRFFLPLLIPMALHAQQNSGVEQLDMSTAPAVTDPYQGGWQVERQQQAADIWKGLSEQAPENAAAQLNYFRSERNACMARNNGTLAPDDKQRLVAIASSMEEATPNTFETHLANYYLEFPARTAFTELGQATVIAPDRTELIGPQLNRANLDGDEAGLNQWTKSLSEKGGLSPALLDVAEDLLLSLDPNAIVFTGGDMDTWPVLVQQRVKNKRKDVLVIDDRLLSDMAYRTRCWGMAKAVGPVPVEGIAFAKALVDATIRPVFFALSLGPEWSEALRNDLFATGIALRYTHSGIDNITVLETRWAAMKKTTAAGPLSINYLLPGAVLLRHYRDTGDEAKTARMETELRALSDKLGATQKMYKLGVFLH